MKIFFRYIQNVISHRTSVKVTASRMGAYTGPTSRLPNGPRPPFASRWRANVSGIQGLRSCAMQYMAIEFVPTTSSGNAQRRYSAQSMMANRPASMANTQPALYSAQVGVQMRLTDGHTY